MMLTHHDSDVNAVGVAQRLVVSAFEDPFRLMR